MMNHNLKDNTLYVLKDGIKAECTCGWVSVHFSGMTASAAFQQHQEDEEQKGKDNGTTIRPTA